MPSTEATGTGVGWAAAERIIIHPGLSTSEPRDENVCKCIKIRISSQLKFYDRGA